MMRRRIAACVFAAAAHAQAAEPPFDPLALQPEPAPQEEAAPLGLRLELWRQQFDLRRPGSSFTNRGVVDFRHEWTVGAWKLGLSDRLEVLRASGDEETRNALRELYASRAFDTHFVDAGRVNWRHGVGAGFNPTDYLKRGAVIDQATQNPQALRENRLGTVMLRGQSLSTLGSAQLALIPDLGDGRVDTQSSLSPAWDRTNGEQAALLKLAPRLGERASVDLLAYTRSHERPQFGANVTWLAGDAWLAHAEWSGGKASALPGPGEAAGAPAWHNAVAAGVTWTTPLGIVAAIEHHHSGDALSRERWAAWQQAMGTPQEAALGQLRGERSRAQAPLVQRAWFMRLAWDDAFGNRDLDLAAFMRVNAFDRSRLWQVDAAWHLDQRHSLRLIGGGFRGDARSEYGSAAVRAYASLSWMMFL